MELDDRRRLVWETLSELYLDNELSESEMNWLRLRLAQTGYSTAQVRQINYDQVAPVLYHNLMMPAGEWGGFDLTWLAQQISRRGSRSGRLFGSRRLWQRWIDYLVGADLNRLLNGVE